MTNFECCFSYVFILVLVYCITFLILFSFNNDTNKTVTVFEAIQLLVHTFMQLLFSLRYEKTPVYSHYLFHVPL